MGGQEDTDKRDLWTRGPGWWGPPIRPGRGRETALGSKAGTPHEREGTFSRKLLTGGRLDRNPGAPDQAVCGRLTEL